MDPSLEVSTTKHVFDELQPSEARFRAILDNTVICMTLSTLDRRYFHKCGRIFWGRCTYSLVCDTNGKPCSLVGLIEDAHPDGIIRDWSLPGCPVRDRISVLRALVPNLKVIVIITRPELRDEILSEGADAFICKTDPLTKILEVIRKLCLDQLII